MTDNNDEQILLRAQEIKSERGLSLTEAMIRAEQELAPKPDIPEAFEITVRLKARVAQWVIDEFGGHPSYTVEDRLGAYVETLVNRSRMAAIRISEEAPEITDSSAVSMSRAKFKAKAPTT